jgi:hypothetical protein
VSDRIHLDALDDPAITAEVERLLARRTRDIRLTGEINRLFRARVWSQTAKIIRAWMIWVAFLDVLTLALYMLLLPRAIALSMLLPGAIIPPVVIAVVLIWRKPRAPWLQGATLIAGMFLILLSVALVGAGSFFGPRAAGPQRAQDWTSCSRRLGENGTSAVGAPSGKFPPHPRTNDRFIGIG